MRSARGCWAGMVQEKGSAERHSSWSALHVQGKKSRNSLCDVTRVSVPVPISTWRPGGAGFHHVTAWRI